MHQTNNVMNADQAFLGGDAAGATAVERQRLARVAAQFGFGHASAPGRLFYALVLFVSVDKSHWVSLQYIAAGAARTTPIEQTRLPALCKDALCPAFVHSNPPPWTRSSCNRCHLKLPFWFIVASIPWPHLFLFARWVFLNALSPPVAFDSVCRAESMA